MLFSVGVLLLVLYLVWAKVTITITPVTAQVSREFFVTVGDDSIEQLSEEERPAIDMFGSVVAVPVTVNQSFEATGETTVSPEEGIAGEVTIINSHGQPQTLVETTRLAAPDDPDTVLVRLAQTITVPAGEEVTVPVYFENPETQTELGPMKLIIPGLWGVLQERIYAEIIDPLGNFERTVAVVTTQDVDAAKAAIRRLVTQEALDIVNEELTSGMVTWPKVVSVDTNTLHTSVQPGVTTRQFQVDYSGDVFVVTFDESDVRRMAQEVIRATDDRSIDSTVGFAEDSFEYSVDFFDPETLVASLKVTARGSTMALQDSAILDKSVLRGMTREEVVEHYQAFPEVSEVSVTFQPQWLKKIPLLSDKIVINIR